MKNLHVAGEMRAIVWALAAFHASTFVFLLVAWRYLEGDLAGTFEDVRSPIGTVAGLTAFLVLWLASLIGTVQALPPVIPARISFDDSLVLTGFAALGGFWAGLVILGVLSVLVIPGFGIFEAITERDPLRIVAGLAGGLAIGLLGSFFAATIGCAVGLFAGVIDCCLLRAAQWVVGPLSEPVQTDTPAS